MHVQALSCMLALCARSTTHRIALERPRGLVAVHVDLLAARLLVSLDHPDGAKVFFKVTLGRAIWQAGDVDLVRVRQVEAQGLGVVRHLAKAAAAAGGRCARSGKAHGTAERRLRADGAAGSGVHQGWPKHLTSRPLR